MKKALIELLRLLSDGAWHSGEDLGRALGVSRAAIWKQLQLLDDFGVVVEKSRGMGYRLAKEIIFLSEGRIRDALLPSCKKNVDLSVVPVLDSTNQQLLQRYMLGQRVHGQVLLAEHQTHGRGRRGRVWQSPYGSNLYFSVAWCFSQGVAATEGLSLAVGVAICRALSGLSVSGVQLKWPNDLLSDHRKLGGVLLEMSGDASGDCCVVVGVGLNVNMPAGADVGQPWIDLGSIQGGVQDRNVVAGRVVSEIVQLLSDYSEKGFRCYRDEWQSLNAFRDSEVTVSFGSRSEAGKCLGVAENGALCVSVDGEEKRFLGGEISLRAS